jgi:hypothetical protein
MTPEEQLLNMSNLSPEERRFLQDSFKPQSSMPAMSAASPRQGLLSRIGGGLLGAGQAVGSGLLDAGRAAVAGIDPEQMSRDIIDTQRFYRQAQMSQPSMVLGSDLAKLQNITPQGIAASLPALRAQERLSLRGPGLFSGTGMTAQAMNVIREIGPLIKGGKASESQIMDYKLAEASLSKPRTQTSFDPATGVQSFSEVPGIDVSGAGFPSFQGKVSLGEKPPNYSESELKSGSFAANMWNAEKSLSLLEGIQGYDPTSSKDYWARMAPLGLKNFVLTPQGQLYSRARVAFVNAALRRESGAAIRNDEFIKKEEELFAAPGATKELVEAARNARKVALDTMIRGSGKFYERNFPKMTIESVYERRGGSGTVNNPTKVNSVSEGDALPPGTFFVLPDGQLGRSE